MGVYPANKFRFWECSGNVSFFSQKNNGSSWDHSGTLGERSVFAG